MGDLRKHCLSATPSADSPPSYWALHWQPFSVLMMSSYGIAFFYWCPVSGLLMVGVVWALDRRGWEPSGVVTR